MSPLPRPEEAPPREHCLLLPDCLAAKILTPLPNDAAPHFVPPRNRSPFLADRRRRKERKRIPSLVFLSLRVDTSFVDRRDSRDQLPSPSPLLLLPSPFWTRRLFVVKAKWCRAGRGFIPGRKDRSDWKRSTLAISDTPHYTVYRFPSLRRREEGRERLSRGNFSKLLGRAIWGVSPPDSIGFGGEEGAWFLG